jgi:hypothetical protein
MISLLSETGELLDLALDLLVALEDLHAGALERKDEQDAATAMAASFLAEQLAERLSGLERDMWLAARSAA